MEVVSEKDIVDHLNEIHRKDPRILNELLRITVKVKDPSVNVVVGPDGDCSMMGVLNGLFPFDENYGGHIARELNEDGTIARFLTLKDRIREDVAKPN